MKAADNLFVHGWFAWTSVYLQQTRNHETLPNASTCECATDVRPLFQQLQMQMQMQQQPQQQQADDQHLP